MTNESLTMKVSELKAMLQSIRDSGSTASRSAGDSLSSELYQRVQSVRVSLLSGDSAVDSTSFFGGYSTLFDDLCEAVFRADSRIVLEVLQVLGAMHVSGFESGHTQHASSQLDKHFKLCNTLWTIVEESKSEEVTLAAMRCFVHLYRQRSNSSGQSITLDSTMFGRIHRFILWFQRLFGASVQGPANILLLTESVRALHVLVEVFSPMGGETFVSPVLIGEVVSLFGAEIGAQKLQELHILILIFLAFIGTKAQAPPLIGFLKSFEGNIAKFSLKLLKSFTERDLVGENIVHSGGVVDDGSLPTLSSTSVKLQKEFMQAFRSYMHSSSEASGSFLPYLDELIDLCGLLVAQSPPVKPTVTLVLAELINSVKDKLVFEKLRKIFSHFCSSLADSETLPVSSHVVCGRIILSLVDHCFNKGLRLAGGATGVSAASSGGRPNSSSVVRPLADGSELLREILRCVVEKFSSLLLLLPQIVTGIAQTFDLAGEDGKLFADIGVEEKCSGQDKYARGRTMINLLVGSGGIGGQFGVPLSDLIIEGVREIRSLIRTLFLVARMILHYLGHRTSSKSLTKSDMALTESLLEDGLKVIHLFSVCAGLVQSAGFDAAGSAAGFSPPINGGSVGNNTSPLARFSSKKDLAVACSIQEERDLIEQISSVLTVVPQISLTDLLAKRIAWLVEGVQVNGQLMTLFNSLIENQTAVQSVCEVLFGYIAIKGEGILAESCAIPITTTSEWIERVADLGIDNGSDSLSSADKTIGAFKSATNYFLGIDGGKTDSSAQLAHVMPSLDETFWTYSLLVESMGLRKSDSTVTVCDVIITLEKTLSRQTLVSSGNSLESIVRPFVTPIVMLCVRVMGGTDFGPDAKHLYTAGLLRYMFRLMGSGMRTSATNKELADLVPLLFDAFYELSESARLLNGPVESGQSAGGCCLAQALWLECAVTLPVRLKSLISHFEKAVCVMSGLLTLKHSAESVAVGLSVLESWVDGLTPDFLVPLLTSVSGGSCRFSKTSLVDVLINVTKPLKGSVVHSAGTGNNSIRAVRILGKLGTRVTVSGGGTTVGSLPGSVDELSTTYGLVLQENETSGAVFSAIEVDIGPALSASLKLIKLHSSSGSSRTTVPLCLQEFGFTDLSGVPTADVSASSTQQLADALNLITTSYMSGSWSTDFTWSSTRTTVSVLGEGLINACGLDSAPIVCDKAKQIVKQLLLKEPLGGIISACVHALASGGSNASAVFVLERFMETCSLQQLVTMSISLVERLESSFDCVELEGMAVGLTTFIGDPKFGPSVVSHLGERIVKSAIGSASINSGSFLKDLAKLVIVKIVAGLTTLSGKSLTTPSAGTSAVPQSSYVEYLNKIGSRGKDVKSVGGTTLMSVVTRLVEGLTTGGRELSSSSHHFSESLLLFAASTLNVSVSGLVCWVDPDFSLFVPGLTSTADESVAAVSHMFCLASFVLQLRPAPILASTVGGEVLHSALLSSINRTLQWLEDREDLNLIYSGTKQVFDLEKIVFERTLTECVEKNSKRLVFTGNSVYSRQIVVEAVRVIKLTLLHTQLSAGSATTTVAPHLAISSVDSIWRLDERMYITLLRYLFSVDGEMVNVVRYVLERCKSVSGISNQVWAQSLVPLARDVASRAPLGLFEISGLKLLLQYLAEDAYVDDAVRNDLSERLFERIQTYLNVMRERTFSPMQGFPINSAGTAVGTTGFSASPATSSCFVSWRAGVHADSVVALAAATVECFSGLLVSHPSGAYGGGVSLERLLVLTMQLESSLPGTNGTGQIASPFIGSLISVVCAGGEFGSAISKSHLIADKLLSKTELHKIFGILAELISTRQCLFLRKALQDKCHQMSLVDAASSNALMQRTAAASLVSVLARNDPAYLWVQYCAAHAAHAKISPNGGTSLLELIVRNWTADSQQPHAITYEQRVISWSVMQFLRAPFKVVPKVITEVGLHQQVRVRLLLRLAMSLSTGSHIEVFPIRDWLLNEVGEITTIEEKTEIIKSVVTDFVNVADVSSKVQVALLKYLAEPLVESLLKGEQSLSSFWTELCLHLESLLKSTESHAEVIVHLIKIYWTIVTTVRSGHDVGETFSALVGRYSGSVVASTVQNLIEQFWVSETGGSHFRTDPFANVVATILPVWRLTRSISRRSGAVNLMDLAINEPVCDRLIELMERSLDTEFDTEETSRDSVSQTCWKFLSSYSASIIQVVSGVVPMQQRVIKCCVKLVRRNQTALLSTENRLVLLDVVLVALLLLRGSADAVSVNRNQCLFDFLFLHAIRGPVGDSAASSQTNILGNVSPTLMADFLDKCLEGVALSVFVNPGVKLSLLNLLEKELVVFSFRGAPPSESLVAKHCRQLVTVNRLVTRYLNCAEESMHALETTQNFSLGLCRLVSLSFVSTDKYVCHSLSDLVEAAVSRLARSEEAVFDIAAFDSAGHNISSNEGLFQVLYCGIKAGLAVASNSPQNGRLAVHAGGLYHLVPPFTAGTVLVALLRGLAKQRESVLPIRQWLSVFRPYLLQALSQGCRSFVFSLLPQHMHAFPLSGGKYAVPDLGWSAGNGSNESGNSGCSFAYGGVLQGSDLVVPTLIHILRLSQLGTQMEGDNVEKSPHQFRQCVLWLMESIGPILSFAAPGHQTFAHLLNGLNFTVPQQSQKLSGASSMLTGGLASAVTTVQLTALMAQCLRLVGAWAMGKPCLDEKFSEETRSEEKNLQGPVLSVSAGLLGSDPILGALSDLAEVAELLATSALSSSTPRQVTSSASNRKSKAMLVTPSVPATASTQCAITMESVTMINHVVEFFDGISVLSHSQVSELSIKRLLGFIPQRAVTCFPGSVLETADGGLWNAKSTNGGLFAIAADLLMETVELCRKSNPGLLPQLSPSILIASLSADPGIRERFTQILMQNVMPHSFASVESRVEFVFSHKLGWSLVSNRAGAMGLLVCCLLANCEEGLGQPKFAWKDSFLSIVQGASVEVAYSALVSVLRQLNRESVHHTLIQFLLQTSKQAGMFEHNLVGAILESAVCAVDPAILVHCAKQQGEWFPALELLEGVSSDSDQIREIKSAQRDILSSVKEMDLYLASFMEEPSADEGTKLAAACMLIGDYSRAQNFLLRDQKNTVEKTLLFVMCEKASCRWTDLASVGIPHPEIQIESFAKSNDWGSVAEIIAQYDWSTKGWSKLFAAFLAMSFCNSSSVDNPAKQRLFLADLEASINRSFHELVSQWNLMPVEFSIDAKTELLKQCQLFVEFSESAGLIAEIRSAVSGLRTSYPSARQLLNSWRDRLPGEGHSLSVWSDVLGFRMTLFKHISQLCQVDVVANSHFAPYLQDYPWALVKYAREASRVGNMEIAQSALQKVQSAVAKSTDAFSQECFDALREQVRVYRKLANVADWRVGLSVLNCCAISNSNSQQAAEIAGMQGRLLGKLALFEEAKNTLVLSVNTYPMIAGSWSNLGDLLFERIVADAEETSKVETSTNKLIDECLLAYMQAVALKPTKLSSKLVPRMLMLSRRSEVLAKEADSQPICVWMPWLDLLVCCAGDQEYAATDSDHLKTTSIELLKRIATEFPQLVYWALLETAEKDKPVIDAVFGDGANEGTNEGTYSGVISHLKEFNNHILQSYGPSEEVTVFVQAASALEDLACKRNVNLKQVLPSGVNLKGGDITEANLQKWIKTEMEKKLLVVEEASGVYTNVSRINRIISGLVEMPIFARSRSAVVNPNGGASDSERVKVYGFHYHHEMVKDGKSSNGGLPFPVVTIIGTNGLLYQYSVITDPVDIGKSTSHYLSSANVLRTANSALARYLQTRQRNIQLTYFDTISVGRNVVLQECIRDTMSLERILDATGNHSANDTSIPPDVLLQWVGASNSKKLFEFRKNFAVSYSAQAAIDVLLGVMASKRSLSEVSLCGDSGKVTVSNRRLWERRAVDDKDRAQSIPLRLTPNIKEVLGEAYLNGVVPGIIRIIADSMHKKGQGFLEYVELLSTIDPQLEPVIQELRQTLNEIVECDEHPFQKIFDIMNDSMQESPPQLKKFLPSY